RSTCFINDQEGTGDLYIGAPGSIFMNAALSGGDDGFQVNSDMYVTGEFDAVSTTTRVKNFRIPHPVKPGMDLLHASTESPDNGVEYWGSVDLDAEGRAVVELPDYFEALTKPEGRSVLLTPIDEAFPVAAGEVADGCVAVHGKPHGRVSWL